jgi:hypothetical protein
MQQAGELAQVWRNIGRLEASVTAIRREMTQMRRDMRDRGSKPAGVPLWGHMLAMALITGASALGFIRPEVALGILRLLGKAVTG